MAVSGKSRLGGGGGAGAGDPHPLIYRLAPLLSSDTHGRCQ